MGSGNYSSQKALPVPFDVGLKMTNRDNGLLLLQSIQKTHVLSKYNHDCHSCGKATGGFFCRSANCINNCYLGGAFRTGIKWNYCAKAYLDFVCLAWYIALSALLTNLSAVVPSFGKIEIPILALMVRSCTPTSQGT